MDNPLGESPDDELEVQLSVLPRRAGVIRRLRAWFGRHRPSGRRAWRLAGISVTVLLGLSLVLSTLPVTRNATASLFRHVNPPRRTTPTASAQTIQSPFGLVPRLDGVHDPVDIAWPPAGLEFAVLGQSAIPTGTGPGEGIVAIYGVTPGTALYPSPPQARMLAEFTPETALLHLLLDQPPLASTWRSAFGGDATSIFFDHILWSPDGLRLALTFTAFDTQNQHAPLLFGLLITDDVGAPVEAVMQPVPSSNRIFLAWEWDLERGDGIALPAVQPALGYRWGGDGTLVAVAPLNTVAAPPAPPLAPVGNPDGAATFTVWQPGIASLQLQTSHSNQPELPGAYTWFTQFMAWSPDGRYVIEPLGPNGGGTDRLAPTGRSAPNQHNLADFGLLDAPLLPVRDAALQDLLLQMPPNTNASDGSQNLRIAWRPDGRELAVQRFVYNDQHVAQAIVTVYDCTSGRQLATLTPLIHIGTIADTRQLGPPEKSDNLLRWSSDGHYLLLYDENLESTTIWGPGLLPA